MFMAALLPFLAGNAQSIERAAVVPLGTFALGSGRLLPAAPFGAGGLAVGTTDQQIVVLDSSGRELSRLGRQGGGPGEFRMLAALSASADTIFALDVGRRLTVIHSSRPVVTHEILVPNSDVLPLNPRALAGHDIILSQVAALGHPIIAARGQLFIRASHDGRVIDTLGWLDVRDQMMRIPLSTQSEVQVVQPYVEMDRMAVSGAGTWLAFVRAPASLHNDDKHSNKVEFIGPRGRRVLKLAVHAQPLRDATVETWLNEQADDLGKYIPGGPSAARRAVAEHLIRPKSHPSVRAAAIGDDGTLWLLQSPVDAPRDKWTLLMHTGESAGFVELRRGSRPLVVSRDAAWVVQDRDDGEQELVRYRIRR